MTDNTTVSPRIWDRDFASYGASTFVDPASNRTYIYANSWIQECDSAGLNWVGKRFLFANQSLQGVGLIENPSLMYRNGWYYMHGSDNGTSNWGLGPAENAGPDSTSYAALSVWRARSILLGPWDGPRNLLTSNVDFASVNTGTAVLGPDNRSWYYLYNAIEVRRWSLQRQLMLDRIDFDGDEWPVAMT
jgi:beta-xylosidase